MKRDKETRIKIVDTLSKQITGEWGSDSGNEEEKVCVLRTTNFRNDGTVNYTNVVTRYVNPVKTESKKLIPGDIILEKSGGSDNFPVGRVVYFENDGVYLCNNFTHILRTDDSIINPRYLFHNMSYLYHCGVTKQYQSKTTGIRNLKVKDYLNVEIPLPPLDVQRRIAETLDKVTELISLRKTQLGKLDELVKARFVEMFDLDNCIWKNFGDCTNFVDYRGKTPELSAVGTIRMVNAKSVGKGFFKYVEEYITEDTYNAWMHKGFGYPGDILFVTEGHTFGNTCLIPSDLKKFALGQRVITIKGHDEVQHKFLCTYMQTDRFWKDINIYRTGGTAQGIRSKDLVKVPLPLPPLSLQNSFASFVSSVEEAKAPIQQSLETLETLKKSLMQEYFGLGPESAGAPGEAVSGA